METHHYVSCLTWRWEPLLPLPRKILEPQVVCKIFLGKIVAVVDVESEQKHRTSLKVYLNYNIQELPPIQDVDIPSDHEITRPEEVLLCQLLGRRKLVRFYIEERVYKTLYLGNPYFLFLYET